MSNTSRPLVAAVVSIAGVLAVGSMAVISGLACGPAPQAKAPPTETPVIAPADTPAPAVSPNADTPKPADTPKADTAKTDAPKPTETRQPVQAPVAGAPKDDPTAPATDPAKSGAPLPMFGGGPTRNMVNLFDKNIPDKFAVDGPTMLWKAELGSKSYGGPTVSGNKVFVGTNNERPRNKRDVAKVGDEEEPIDRGVMMCFDTSGKFLWQAVHKKLEAGQVVDWPHEGICSTPTVDGDRVYYVSNRCTVVCATLDGIGGGKKGKPLQFVDDKTKKPAPPFDTPTDADVVWEFDMMRQAGVQPHNMSAGCPLVVGDLLYTVTGNGVDEGHINIPSPNAPSFICLNKKTGELVWKENLPGKNVMHGQWSNPAYADIGGVKQVIFPGGDGWLYSFSPDKGELLWKFDANPKDSVYELGGSGTRSDFIGTPVIYDNKVYIGTGQDPEHYFGIAHFYCIDPAGKKGDISPEVGPMLKKGEPNPNSAVVWHYGGADARKLVPRDFSFGRTMSSACIVDGVLYISELQGYLHCLDAKTGKKYWQYDTKGGIWGSPYYVDGKVYLATEAGAVFVFKHTKTPEVVDELDNPDAADQKSFNNQLKAKRKQVEAKYLLGKVELDAAIRSTPVAAGGVLYVMTENTLYAFANKK